jgi:hypothetical protein
MRRRSLRKLLPHEKAHATGRWAEIIFRALSARIAKRWRFVSFRGAAHGEWRGIVDVLAIRKDTSEPIHRTLKRGAHSQVERLCSLRLPPSRAPQLE